MRPLIKAYDMGALIPFLVPIFATILVLILVPELVTYLPHRWIGREEEKEPCIIKKKRPPRRPIG